MVSAKASLIIPVETQVREFDAKLLLACIAARRGFPSVIGSRFQLDLRISSFPRSLYLSKSMTARSIKMFRILTRLGHEIAAWDEEALVHMPSEVYFSRRLSSIAINHVSHLFAWGQEDADLWRSYPDLPSETPIHITGNPRGDLLRTEMRPYFNDEVSRLREAHGDFFLINTNFNEVNAFVPMLNLVLPTDNAPEEPALGRAAIGMSREYAQGLSDHKLAILEDFKRLIPALGKAFPDRTIIVRPHPTEHPRLYHELAAQCERVRVINEGNVIPWLLAAKALIHNGCTTAIEAYLLGVPAITYQATVNKNYDYGYYRFPNLISHQCFSFEEMEATLRGILVGEIGAADGDERRALVDHHLAAREGPLACERMVDVLEEIMEGRSALPRPPIHSRLRGRYGATKRRLQKWAKSHIPGSKYRPEFQDYRYPGLSLDEIRARISRIQKILGHAEEPEAEQLSSHIFRISL
jgi:surface carbohydrate biosynthesis protein